MRKRCKDHLTMFCQCRTVHQLIGGLFLRLSGKSWSNEATWLVHREEHLSTFLASKTGNPREPRKVEAKIVNIRIGEADWLDGRERLQDLGLCDSCDSLHDSLVTAYLGEVLGVLDTGRERSCICRASKHLEDRVSDSDEGLSQGSILSIKWERKEAVLNN